MTTNRDMTVATPREIYEMLDWKRVEILHIIDCIEELKPNVTSAKQYLKGETRDNLYRAVTSLELLMELYQKDFN